MDRWFTSHDYSLSGLQDDQIAKSHGELPIEFKNMLTFKVGNSKGDGTYDVEHDFVEAHACPCTGSQFSRLCRHRKRAQLVLDRRISRLEAEAKAQKAKDNLEDRMLAAPLTKANTPFSLMR